MEAQAKKQSEEKRLGPIIGKTPRSNHLPKEMRLGPLTERTHTVRRRGQCLLLETQGQKEKDQSQPQGKTGKPIKLNTEIITNILAKNVS